MATESRVVKMSDGRSITFGKRERVKFETMLDESSAPIGLEIQFGNGEILKGLISEWPETAHLVIRGAKEKIQNEGSKEKVVTDGDMFDYAKAMLERMKAGTAFDRATGPRGPRLDQLTIEAMMLAMVDSQSNKAGEANDPNLLTLRATVVSTLLSMTEEERKQLPAIEELESFFEMARAAANREAKVDKAALFGKFKLNLAPKQEEEEPKAE
jgi:hypothetical protein